MSGKKRAVVRSYNKLKSFFASIYFGNIFKPLVLIGITGTSGKSTTTALTYHLLKSAGFKVGMISTIGAMTSERTIETGLHVTTPNAIDLQKIIKEMLKDGIEYLIIESSSHSLDQGRLGFMRFDYSIFTNIKKDHLDYHLNWEDYANSKGRLIDKLRSNGKVILNKDDTESYNFLIENKVKQKFPLDDLRLINYSSKDEVKNISTDLNGSQFEFQGKRFNLSLLGEYNVDNCIAAIKLAQSLGISLEKIIESVKTFKGIEGRMEIVQNTPFTIIIDFAHNADSLEKSLMEIRKFIKPESRLISVFGSAGLRDVEKRGKMGEISALLSDITIITAEDPRIESLYDINTEIIEGTDFRNAKLIRRFKNHTDYLENFNQYIDSKFNLNAESNLVFAFDEESVDSRYDAIDFAIRIAKPGDIVITQGKGHEKSLNFNNKEYPFTDKDAILKGLSNSNLVKSRYKL